ncbi:hypothetical protein ACYJ2U_001739 [Clostridium botulinum]
MKFDTKFHEEIIIDDKVVLAIYGDFNADTGHCSLYFNPLDTENIKNNKEEVEKQIQSAKTELNKKMTNEGFFYTI